MTRVIDAISANEGTENSVYRKLLSQSVASFQRKYPRDIQEKASPFHRQRWAQSP
jgi:hypothetical protein